MQDNDNTEEYLDATEHLHLGMNASLQGKRAKAAEHYQRSYNIEPSARALYLLAAEHLETDKHSQAIDEMRQAIQLDPTLHYIHLHLAILLLQDNQKDQAELVLANLCELPDGNYFGHFGRGVYCMMVKDLPLAEAELERGLELNQEHPSFNKHMAGYLAQVRLRLGRPDVPVSEGGSINAKE